MRTPRTRAGVDRLRQFLGDGLQKQNLHNRLFALWASTAIDGLLTADRRDAIIKQVLAKQQEDGGWSLSSLVDCKRERWDAAGDGVRRLRHRSCRARPAARRASVAISPPSARAGRGCAPISRRTATGSRSSLNKRRDPKTHVGKFMSDSATTFAILALETSLNDNRQGEIVRSCR